MIIDVLIIAKISAKVNISILRQAQLLVLPPNNHFSRHPIQDLFIEYHIR